MPARTRAMFNKGSTHALVPLTAIGRIVSDDESCDVPRLSILKHLKAKYVVRVSMTCKTALFSTTTIMSLLNATELLSFEIERSIYMCEQARSSIANKIFLKMLRSEFLHVYRTMAFITIFYSNAHDSDENIKWYVNKIISTQSLKAVMLIRTLNYVNLEQYWYNNTTVLGFQWISFW